MNRKKIGIAFGFILLIFVLEGLLISNYNKSHNTKEAGTGFDAIELSDDGNEEYNAPEPEYDDTYYEETYANVPYELATLKEDVPLRILIRNPSNGSEVHERFSICAKGGFLVYSKAGVRIASGKETQSLSSSRLKLKTGDKITVTGNKGELTLSGVEKEQGNPTYCGKMDIYKTQDGYVLVNEVSMEEYLYSVLPSEMPSNYPKEALKSQAVCARTYAYYYYCNPALYEWEANMDDSTNFQVYNNIGKQTSTNEAVDETRGQILLKNGQVYPTYFFSTSCGITTDESVFMKQKGENSAIYMPSVVVSLLQEDAMECFSEIRTTSDLSDEANFRRFLSGEHFDAVEKTEAYYRWEVSVPVSAKELLQRLKNCSEKSSESVWVREAEADRFQTGCPETLSKIYSISVSKRLKGGVCDELLIESDTCQILVKKEYYIRMILSDSKSEVLRNDGQKKVLGALLPSGFFVIDPVYDENSNEVKKLEIMGGGLGHGVGMSQNGAKQLAENGFDYIEILDLFYHIEDCSNRVCFFS